MTLLLSEKEIDVAVKLLQKDETVVFPTETVYGVGANALRSEAIEKIFLAKKRPRDNPLIVHVGSIEQVRKIAVITPLAEKLMKKYWPGALTLVLEKKEGVPEVTTAGLPTVCVRMPDNKIALELINKCGFPLAAPSANISGRPSATTAHHVLQDLKGKVSAVIDGGSSRLGLESTVLDVTRVPAVILRPGNITYEQLVEDLGQVVNSEEHANAPKSPGTKYTHYSPRTPVTLCENLSAETIQQLIDDYQGDVGIIGFSEFKAEVCITVSRDGETFGKELYSLLRDMDTYNLDMIFIEAFDEGGVGAALMNRLRKAATYVEK